MEELLSKIYDAVICYEDDAIVYQREYASQVEEHIKLLEESMTESQIEAVREILYELSFKAEKYGFLLGAEFMVKIILEAIKK